MGWKCCCFKHLPASRYGILSIKHLAVSTIPTLRLLVPFVIGLIVSVWFPGWSTVLIPFLLGIMAYALLYTRCRVALTQYKLRSWWIVPIMLLSLSAGALAMELSRPRTIDLVSVNGHQACGVVDEIELYDFGMRLHVMATELGGQPVSPRHILLTTRGCNYDLHEGDVIAFGCNLSPISNLGNPDEFDRQNHLWQRGILYSQHLPIEQISRIGHRTTLLSQAALLRRHLIARVLQTTLSPSSQDLMIALLLGNNRQMDSSVRERFSTAGIAHILALSGLHVGLITSLIWFLLFPLDYLRLKKLRLVVTLAVLAAFALLTGLSPSVVRATIMIGFTLVAIVLYRKSVVLNAMCISALLTLCIWPTAIFQAGFQLSYITVAAIVGLQPKLSLVVKDRLLGKFWQLLCTSLIAMAATIMLCAYYFSQISLLSVLSNVFILPVMPVLMLLGVIFLFLAGIGLEWTPLNYCIEGIYGYMNQVSTLVSNIPGSHISGVYVTGASVILFYVSLACFVVWLLTHRGRWLVIALAWFVAMTGQLLWLRVSSPSRCLLVLNDYYSTPILWCDSNHTYAWLPDNRTADPMLFEQTHRRLLAHLGSDTLSWVIDSVRGQHSLVRSPFAFVQSRRVLVAGKGMNKQWFEQAERIGSIDLLIVTKRFHGQLSDVVAHCHSRLVILSGDLPADLHAKHLAACRELHLQYYDLKQSGAYFAVD